MSVSDLTKQLFAGLKNAGPEIAAEVGRLNDLGKAELASMLFNGSSFVLYGSGQQTPTPEYAPEHPNDQQPDRQHDRGGMER